MIFPILNGILGWRKAPIAWCLLALNFMVFSFTAVWGGPSTQALESVMHKPYFVAAQGEIYAQYLEDRPEYNHPEFVRSIGRQVREGSINKVDLLGQLAFRDFNFLNDADSVEYDGDQVALKIWKRDIAQVREHQALHPSFLFGLKTNEAGFANWISYIFVHSGWFHLVGNMLFLLIFGAALERQIGGLGFLVVFLLSGLVAAGVFALLTGVTGSPLVGASGAVSGTMALYCVLNWKRPERYVYWFFLPLRGFMGFVYLPAWVALVLWVISDLAGFMATLPELGGVAHTAHLGGEAAGLITGLVLFGLRRFWPVPDAPALSHPKVAIGVLMPFLPEINRSTTPRLG